MTGLPTGLFYYDAGPQSAPALLLLHGLGDEADTWRRVIAPLSRSYRVIAPDLPGFGRSPLPRRRLFSPPFLAGVLLSLLDSLGIDRVGLVGSSLGASLLQYVATVRPEICSRLVLVDGGIAATSQIPPSMIPTLIPGVGERGYARLAAGRRTPRSTGCRGRSRTSCASGSGRGLKA